MQATAAEPALVPAVVAPAAARELERRRRVVLADRARSAGMDNGSSGSGDESVDAREEDSQVAIGGKVIKC